LERIRFWKKSGWRGFPKDNMNPDTVKPLIGGSRIDYVDGLHGSGFKVSNPNARHSCGCGSSFG